MSRTRLTIDRLILDGVPLSRAESAILGESFEAELSRLVSAGGVSHRELPGRVLHPLAGEPVALDRTGSPTEWGRQVAASVYGTLTRPIKPKLGGTRRK